MNPRGADRGRVAAATGEFELIERFFTRAAGGAVALGIGDDCALLDPPPGMQWAVTTDMLVEGTHFLSDVDAAALGHKALAVNLSDLAACGAQPQAFFLALALPHADEQWLAAFAKGMFALAERSGCSLAGGDTTRSKSGVAITITALGTVARGQALLRSGAAPGDDLWVSGTLGDAALGLAARSGQESCPAVAGAIDRLEWPTPRLALGQALVGIASSAIDVSDGLVGDLGHIVKRSAVGARVDWSAVPRSAAVRQLPAARQQQLALAGGDDYELLFTAAPSQRARVEQAATGARVEVCRLGSIDSSRTITVLDERGQPLEVAFDAYQHFR